MKPLSLLITLLLLVSFFRIDPTAADTLPIHDAKTLRDAITRAQPGDILSLATGNYGNGILISKLNGSKDKPIIISAADPKNPPLFEGGKEAIHLSSCNYVTLRHLKVSACQANGINADDGGHLQTPSVGLVFENITIQDIGPKGNKTSNQTPEQIRN
ncbi:MAG: hypothetical protein L3J39_10185 [Verrucomicrobiales bacterium]|nr:hypothetical protein [Verrucomicrobiales bacterium]